MPLQGRRNHAHFRFEPRCCFFTDVLTAEPVPGTPFSGPNIVNPFKSIVTLSVSTNIAVVSGLLTLRLPVKT